MLKIYSVSNLYYHNNIIGKILGSPRLNLFINIFIIVFNITFQAFWKKYWEKCHSIFDLPMIAKLVFNIDLKKLILWIW